MKLNALQARHPLVHSLDASEANYQTTATRLFWRQNNENLLKFPLMWRDNESDQDFLNFTELADQIVTLVTNDNLLPISIGVFGTWGTGKSTVLRLVESRLPKEGKHSVVKFDAWLYQGFDDARMALMEVVSTQLLALAEDNKTLLAKAKTLVGRVNYFRALSFAGDIGLSMALGVPPGFLSFTHSVAAALAGKGTAADAGEIKGGILQSISTFGGLLKPGEKRTPPKEIKAFRDEFGELLEGLGTTLVLFIDNLDRCLPDVAIGTLEAVRLFLFIPGTAFVIAADEDMIRHSVAKHFKDPQASHVRDYLDKVIQVPLHVPQVGAEDLRAYMYSLFVGLAAPASLSAIQTRLLKALQESWSGASFDKEEISGLAGNPERLLDNLAIADRLAPILASAPQVQGNPRIVKRLLNAVLLRQQLAVRRSMLVDLATLSKLAVFERCTDEAATRALYRIVMEDTGPARYIGAADTGGKPLPLPEEWKPYEAFINEWRAMEPLFNESIDLKPAVFLSRDVLAPAVYRSGLSAGAQASFEALLRVDSINSPAAVKIIATFTASEKAIVMTQLVDLMRRADWSKPVPGVYAALILAKDTPQLSAPLKAFAGTIPQETMDSGIKYQLKRAALI